MFYLACTNNLAALSSFATLSLNTSTFMKHKLLYARELMKNNDADPVKSTRKVN